MKPEDLEVSTVFPPSMGGQHTGATETAVKVLHRPTGLYAVSKYERSQHRNRVVAIAMVEYGLAEMGWKDQP